MELDSEDYFKSKFETERMRLLEYMRSGLELVRVVSVGGCQACIDMMGKVLTINEALKEMPIPVKDCTFKLHGKIPGWCRCRYIPYFDNPKLDTPDSYYEDLKKKRVSELANNRG